MMVGLSFRIPYAKLKYRILKHFLITSVALAALTSINADILDTKTFTQSQMAVSYADPVSFSLDYPKEWKKVIQSDPPPQWSIYVQTNRIQCIIQPIQVATDAAPFTAHKFLVIQRMAPERHLRSMRSKASGGLVRRSRSARLEADAIKTGVFYTQPKVRLHDNFMRLSGPAIQFLTRPVQGYAPPPKQINPTHLMAQRSCEAPTLKEAQRFETALTGLNLNYSRKNLEPVITKSGVSGHMLVFERDAGQQFKNRLISREYFLAAHGNSSLHITALTMAEDLELNAQLHDMILKSFTFDDF